MNVFHTIASPSARFFRTATVVGLVGACTLLLGVDAGAEADDGREVVGLELCMLVDESGSVNKKEWNLQRSGYINAFRNESIHKLVKNSDGIAVQYVPFAEEHQQRNTGWHVLRTAQDCLDYAGYLQGIGRSFKGPTGMANAIDFAVRSIDENDIRSRKQVVDISGDGEDENFDREEGYGLDWEDTIDGLPKSLTVNGISIGSGKDGKLGEWYARYLGLGPNGFTMNVESFEAFEEGILEKLNREISRSLGLISFD